MQETRHWDEIRRITISLRLKEEEQDYRYFPEADLVPVTLTKQFVQDVKKGMPEMPEERAKRFQKDYHLSGETAQILVREKALADFFEEAAKHSKDARELGSWLAVDLQAYLNEYGKSLEELKLTPQHFAELANMVSSGEVSRGAAKTAFVEMLKTGRMPRSISEEKGLKVISDTGFVESLIDKIFSENPQAVQDALKDPKAVNFLLGQIMRATKGRVDPAVANRLVRERLAAAKGSK